MVELLILIAGLYQSLVIAFDHLAVNVVQTLCAQAVLIGIATVMIAPYGILGACVAGIAAQVIMCAGGILFLYKRYGYRIPRRTAWRIIYVIVAVALAGTYGATHDALSPSVLGGKIAVYAAALASLALLMSQSEKAAVWRLLQSVRGRTGSR